MLYRYLMMFKSPLLRAAIYYKAPFTDYVPVISKARMNEVLPEMLYRLTSHL